ncbi:MAG: tetratricopeptide repeat protein [Succinivibrio sp.]
MKINYKLSLIACAVCLTLASSQLPAYAAKYDVVTSTKSMVAKDTLEGLDLSKIANAGNASTEMYSPDRMNSIIENTDLISVIKDQDRCQFTSDIEDRARLVKSPVFMYAWGIMLLSGTCVREDRDLAIGYIRKAADEGYAPAMVKISQFFERGLYIGRNLTLSEQYMHTAAALGSKTARLGWADMLVRGFGTPSLYEEAYGWLYHSEYEDNYSKAKKAYLQTQLKKHLPPNVIARNEAFEPDY